ncbi:MAG: KEOPS complex subunit Cgi121 [Candidatus Syntropharchaeales archaeon]
MIKLHNEVCGREPDIAIFWGFANIKDVKYLMNEISKLEQDHNLTIQIVGAAFVAGEGHVISAVKKAIRSMDAGEAIASSLSLEILLYLAGTRNISKALKIGVKEGRSDVVVLIIGDTIEDGIKEKVFELLSFEPSAIASFDEGRRNRLIEFFEITAEELASVGENKLEKLVMERVALLDLTK